MSMNCHPERSEGSRRSRAMGSFASLRMTAGALVLASAAPALAQDRAELDRAQIIGNRELPKVLYIVPWKKPLPGDLSGRPPVSVLDEALAPLDRDVFRREVRYDAQALAKSPPGASAKPAAGAPARPAAAAPAQPAPVATR